jgi:hypothetical protein
MSLRPRVYQVHTADSDSSPDDLASALCELRTWTGGLPLQSQDTAPKKTQAQVGVTPRRWSQLLALIAERQTGFELADLLHRPPHHMPIAH